MTTLRFGLLLAATAILPSCGRHHDHWVWVTVHNDGTASADIWAEAEYWSSWGGGAWDQHLDSSVAPGESTRFGFRFDDLSRLKVRIYRSSDHLKIFDDFWDRQDLEHLDEQVTITVVP